MAGEIISERRARSNRNGGRHHPGFAGDFPRNPQQGLSVSAIARHLERDRKTVRKYIERGLAARLTARASRGRLW
jgi:hypothetical protein